MFPKYALKFYDSTGALKYTITDEALSIITHMGLNEDTGWFAVTLPTVIGIPSTYAYKDITKNWTMKAWFGWDTVSTAGVPDFMGKVYQTSISNPSGGYIRIISGKSNSEILQRRIKSRRIFDNMAADLVAITLANDLGLTLDFDADSTLVTLIVDQESYLDVLKRLSDYWYDAGTQLKKDYYVNTSNKLVWKSRPIRPPGVVESITEVLNYNVVRDGTQIANNIKVYGRKVPFAGVNDADNKFLAYQIFGRKNPTDGDSYTHGTGWVDIQGVTSSQSTTPDPAVGANYTQSDSDDTSHDCEFYRTLAAPISCEGYDGYDAIEFWTMRYAMGNGYVRLYCPNSGNYYQAGPFDLGLVDNTWLFHRFSLGIANTYDAAKNPTGQWTATGSPDWENIKGIYFSGYSSTMDAYMGVDGLCFNFGRWRNTARSQPSIDLYEQHDLVVVDDLLNSDSECETRACTLLYQQQYPIIRLDVTVNGNTNILIGDRLSITLPAESAAPIVSYVTSVEQHFIKEPEGWTTIATMVDTLNTRNVPAATPQDTILKELKRQREIGRGRLSKIS